MAIPHGMNAVIKIDDSGGTLRDLSAFVNSVEGLPGEGEVSETTTFATGVVPKTFIRGNTTSTFTIAGFYDSTATTGPDVVLSGLRTSAATATFEYGPEGGTTGKVRYTGEALLTRYTTSAPVGDAVSFTAEFQVTGAVTKNTFP